MFKKHCFCMFLMVRGRKNTIFGQKTWFLGPKTDFWVRFPDFLNRCYSFTTQNRPWYAKNAKNRQKPEKTRFLGQKTRFSCQKHGFRVKTDQNWSLLLKYSTNSLYKVKNWKFRKTPKNTKKRDFSSKNTIFDQKTRKNTKKRYFHAIIPYIFLYKTQNLKKR